MALVWKGLKIPQLGLECPGSVQEGSQARDLEERLKAPGTSVGGIIYLQ